MFYIDPAIQTEVHKHTLQIQFIPYQLDIYNLFLITITVYQVQAITEMLESDFCLPTGIMILFTNFMNKISIAKVAAGICQSRKCRRRIRELFILTKIILTWSFDCFIPHRNTRRDPRPIQLNYHRATPNICLLTSNLFLLKTQVSIITGSATSP